MEIAHRRNVVLTGFMGTGKTTIGRVLADRLGYDFVDTDQLIESRHGSVAAIFAEHGEGRFRRLEREIAAELADRDGVVVATGGRMMLDPVNGDVLGGSGLVVCLTATVDTIVGRVGVDAAATRPLLAGHDLRARVAELLAERAPSYARYVQVATDERSPTEIAAQIAALLA